MAEINRLEQDSKFLEEELTELERIQDASAICEELLLDVEGRPDALLPITHVPVNPTWNRWFEGPPGRLQMSDNVIEPLQENILPYGFKEHNFGIRR